MINLEGKLNKTAKGRRNVNVIVPGNLGQVQRVSSIIMLCYTIIL